MGVDWFGDRACWWVAVDRVSVDDKVSVKRDVRVVDGMWGENDKVL